MASIKQKTTKNGETVYQIQISGGRGRRITRNWKPEPTWSERTIQRELAKYAADLENSLAAGQLITRQEQEQANAQATIDAAKVRTLQDYALAVFMPEKALTFTHNSLANYHQSFRTHIFPALGAQPITDITPAMLKAFFSSMAASGKAHASIIKYYTILHSLFKSALFDDTITINPMEKVPRPKAPKDAALRKQTEKAYTEDEMLYILSCLEKEPLQWQVFIRLLTDTAIRRGEACGLQWDCIDFETATITIKRNLQYTTKGGVYESTPKNGKARNIDIDPDLIPLLRQLRATQAPTVRWVFAQENSAEPMHPQTPTHYFPSFGKRYGVDHFHPHKLRHTNASIAITNGADVVSVSQRLGHADASTTLKMYAHANEESIRRAGQTARDALKRHQA